MKKEGVANPYQYDPCIDCGKPARRYIGGSGRCRACYDELRAAQHGTESRYSAGCTCDLCRAAASAARRQRRAALSPEARAATRARERERWHRRKTEGVT